MKKKRIIFKLIFFNNKFYLSRNFKLQEVGDVQLLFERLKFQNISDGIDELVILNVSKKNFNNPLSKDFINSIETLMKKTFLPLTIGGGLRKMSQVKECFKIGADKVLLNSSIDKNEKLLKSISDIFGRQALILGVDVKKINGEYFSFINNGTKKYKNLKEHLKKINKLKCGEVFLTSIDRDGTGFGFDENILKSYNLEIPVIISGGAGKPEHFYKLIKEKKISGLMTGNLYNFLGNGLPNLRNELLKKKINLRVI